MILSIDPGTTESAYVLYDPATAHVISKGKLANADLLLKLYGDFGCESAVIEMVASYGMSVGREVFETVYWAGRFHEALDGGGVHPDRLYRLDVKLHLCHNSRANDSNIRRALIDRFGPSEREAIGIKSKPGPLYGFKADTWAALALAITYADKRPVSAPAAALAGEGT